MSKEPHPCIQADKIEAIKEDTGEIKVDIREIKQDLSEHMSRTTANETRIRIMEDFVKINTENQQKNFELMLKANKETLTQFNRQQKVLLGIFAALAILVSAFLAT
jgi:hypothetical protein